MNKKVSIRTDVLEAIGDSERSKVLQYTERDTNDFIQALLINLFDTEMSLNDCQPIRTHQETMSWLARKSVSKTKIRNLFSSNQLPVKTTEPRSLFQLKEVIKHIPKRHLEVLYSNHKVIKGRKLIYPEELETSCRKSDLSPSTRESLSAECTLLNQDCAERLAEIRHGCRFGMVNYEMSEHEPVDIYDVDRARYASCTHDFTMDEDVKSQACKNNKSSKSFFKGKPNCQEYDGIYLSKREPSADLIASRTLKITSKQIDGITQSLQPLHMYQYKDEEFELSFEQQQSKEAEQRGYLAHESINGLLLHDAELWFESY